MQLEILTFPTALSWDNFRPPYLPPNWTLIMYGSSLNWENPEKRSLISLLVHCVLKRVRALLRALMRFLGLSSLACVPSYSTWLFFAIPVWPQFWTRNKKSSYIFTICRKLGLWITRTSSSSTIVCTFNYSCVCMYANVIHTKLCRLIKFD